MQQDPSSTPREPVFNKNIKSSYDSFFPDVIQTFLRRHHHKYVPPHRIKPVSRFKDCAYLHALLATPLGRDAFLLALRYSLSFIVPLNPPPVITPEFLATHLFRKMTGGPDFVTLNGIYGNLGSDALGFYSNQRISHPADVHVDLFHHFPHHFYDRAPTNLDKTAIDRHCSIIDVDSFQTVFGGVAVFFVTAPLAFDGCEWNWQFDSVERSHVCVLPRPFDVSFVQTESPAFNDLLLSRGVFESNASRSCEEIEENEKLKLRVLFEHPDLIYHSCTRTLVPSPIELRLVDLLKHDAVVEYLDATKAQLAGLVAGKTLEERIKIVNRIAEGVKKKFPPQTPPFSSLEEDDLRRLLRNLITSMYYPLLWPPLFASSDSPQPPQLVEDELITTIISQHQFLRARHLDVSFLDSPEAVSGIDLVIQVFRMMNNVCSPAQKIGHLRNAFKLLQSLIYIFLPKGESISADLLLPSLIYVVIRANPPHLASTFAFLNAYLSTTTTHGETSYFVSNLFSVVTYLKDLDASKLSIDPDEYRASLTAMSHACEMDTRRENGVLRLSSVQQPSELTASDREDLLRSVRFAAAENRRLRLLLGCN